MTDILSLNWVPMDLESPTNRSPRLGASGSVAALLTEAPIAADSSYCTRGIKKCDGLLHEIVCSSFQCD